MRAETRDTKEQTIGGKKCHLGIVRDISEPRIRSRKSVLCLL